ncbi:phage tail protein [Serratia odorifera]|uniref:phage tail protein n=1 Tax=Serratia odorifera TaxID=618 RepID=UPI002360E452|nr:phage tail protein [Serratia odorifera]
MADYYAILTNTGKALEADAVASGTKIILTHFVVGDGNGQAQIPDPTRTALVHEVYRNGISDLFVSAEQTSQIVAQCVLPANTGGFSVREIGLLTDKGELYAIANCAAFDKPPNGVSITMQFRLAVSETDSVTLNVATGEGLFLRIDQNLSDVKDKNQARANLGLGSMSRQNSNEVNIEGGKATLTELTVIEKVVTKLLGVGSNSQLFDDVGDLVAQIGTKTFRLQNNGEFKSERLTAATDIFVGRSGLTGVRIYTDAGDLVFQVNDKIFKLQNNGEIISPLNVRASGRVYSGDSYIKEDGNIFGTVFGGFINDWIDRLFAKKSDIQNVNNIGSYAFARLNPQNTSVDYGALVSGSILSPAGVTGYPGAGGGNWAAINAESTSLPGSWRCLGQAISDTEAGNRHYGSTLFVRVS